MQVPHPLQIAGSMQANPFSSTWGTPQGHVRTQVRQAAHFPRETDGATPRTSIRALERMPEASAAKGGMSGSRTK